MLIIICVFISGKERLWNFNIIVGPNYKCGSSSNSIAIGNTKAFTCEPNARGTSLKIQIKGRKECLTLCEVFIFGTGMVEENRCIN